MQPSYKTPIWLYSEPIDFRKQIDGLVMLIASELSHNPTSGECYVFRNRKRDKIKLLWYDSNGFWLCYKRLASNRFQFPSSSELTWELTRDELSWLLSGLDFTKQTALSEVKASQFF